jgi:hypothetical protein
MSLVAWSIPTARKQIVGFADASSMIDPEPPELWPPKTIPSDEDYERLAAALRDFSDDQRVKGFIKRLNYLIENVVRKK